MLLSELIEAAAYQRHCDSENVKTTFSAQPAEWRSGFLAGLRHAGAVVFIKIGNASINARGITRAVWQTIADGRDAAIYLHPEDPSEPVTAVTASNPQFESVAKMFGLDSEFAALPSVRAAAVARQREKDEAAHREVERRRREAAARKVEALGLGEFVKLEVANV